MTMASIKQTMMTMLIISRTKAFFDADRALSMSPSSIIAEVYNNTNIACQLSLINTAEKNRRFQSKTDSSFTSHDKGNNALDQTENNCFMPSSVGFFVLLKTS